MQKFVFAIIIGFLFVNVSTFAQCDNSLIAITKNENGGSKYIKHFKIRFEKSKNPKKASVANFTILLNKGSHYRFNVHNDNTRKGHAILTLYDDYNVYGSNYLESADKEYKYFDFYCKKTSPYYISLKFKNGEEGCAVGMLSYVKQFTD